MSHFAREDFAFVTCVSFILEIATQTRQLKPPYMEWGKERRGEVEVQGGDH